MAAPTTPASPARTAERTKVLAPLPRRCSYLPPSTVSRVGWSDDRKIIPHISREAEPAQDREQPYSQPRRRPGSRLRAADTGQETDAIGPWRCISPTGVNHSTRVGGGTLAFSNAAPSWPMNSSWAAFDSQTSTTISLSPEAPATWLSRGAGHGPRSEEPASSPRRRLTER